MLNYWRDTQTEVATIDSISSQGDELLGLSSLVTGPNPSAIVYKDVSLKNKDASGET